LRRRFGEEPDPKVLLNSVPKAGTNLLKRVVALIRGTSPRTIYHLDERVGRRTWRELGRAVPGQVLTGHLVWSSELAARLETDGFRVFLMVRDPRDVIVSGVNYVTNMDLDHPLHLYFKSLGSDRDRLIAYIRGIPAELWADAQVPTIWRDYDLTRFLGWLNDRDCAVVRFEDLVGPKGGGQRRLQIQAIASIASHLGRPLDEAEAARVADLAFSARSRTFHCGQIGRWQDAFDEEVTETFRAKYAPALARLGYGDND
jgi:hypothetical protein